MVRWIPFLSFLTTASLVLARASVTSGPPAVPGAFMFEFEEDADIELFRTSFEGHADVRKHIDRKLFRGTSLQFHDAKSAAGKAAELAKLPGIKGFHSIHTISLPDEVVWAGSPQEPKDSDHSRLEQRDGKQNHTLPVNSPHIMTQVDKLRAKGFTGRGIRVGVVDSGIDYTHPALGGCFGKGCLVSYGMDLVGNKYPNETKPGPDPKDCLGHGTHVAGIIAAQTNPFGFTGAAPGVELGAFKVFGCSGPVEDEQLIDGFYAAHEAESDIISASVGGPGGWSTSLLSLTINRVVEAGVICVIAAGNEGTEGMFFASDPASAANAITVASFQNIVTPKLLTEGFYDIDNGKEVEFTFQTDAPGQWKNLSLPFYAISNDTEAVNDTCTELPDDTPDLSGHITLIRRGGCFLKVKLDNAVARGAQYIMIIDNGAGVVDIPTNDVKTVAAMVSADLGAKWVDALRNGSTVTMHTDKEKPAELLRLQNNTVNGGFPSIFTTWGPTWDLRVKPNVGSPGGNILSTYPLAKGGYAVLDGTSMATPLVSGAIALIAEARGTLDPVEMVNLLAASAKASNFNNGNQTIDMLAPVPQQGGGLIQAYDAAFANVVLGVASISFNDSGHGNLEYTFSIRNTGKADLSFDFRHRPAATAYTYAVGTKRPMAFPNDMIPEHADITLKPSHFAIKPDETIQLTVTAVPNKNLDSDRLPVWSGYIELLSSDGKVHSIPYMGIGAYMFEEPILGNQTNIYLGTPELAQEAMADPKNGDLSDFNITAGPINMTFELPFPDDSKPSDTLPVLCVELEMGSAVILVDVVPVGDFKHDGFTVSKHLSLDSIGSLMDAPRQHKSRYRFLSAWDGELMNTGGKYVPEGKYKLVVRGLKFYGDAMNPDDYDTWESPVLHIVYKEKLQEKEGDDDDDDDTK